jgi:hypothetical protein
MAGADVLIRRHVWLPHETARRLPKSILGLSSYLGVLTLAHSTPIIRVTFQFLPGVGCTHCPGAWFAALRFFCRWSSTHKRLCRSVRRKRRPSRCVETTVSGEPNRSYCPGSYAANPQPCYAFVECSKCRSCRDCNRVTSRGNRWGRIKLSLHNLEMSPGESLQSQSLPGMDQATPSTWGRRAEEFGDRTMQPPAMPQL